MACVFSNYSVRAEHEWDNAPGGTVVREWEEREDDEVVKYVAVVFKKSPGIEYIYYA